MPWACLPFKKATIQANNNKTYVNIYYLGHSVINTKIKALSVLELQKDENLIPNRGLGEVSIA